jgi:hypothetical protein
MSRLAVAIAGPGHRNWPVWIAMPSELLSRNMGMSRVSLSMDQNKATRGSPAELESGNFSQDRDMASDRERPDQSGGE